MSDDLFSAAAKNPPKSNIADYNVSDISNALKRNVEEKFSRVRVRGELSQVKIPASGHMYSSLKDDQAVLDIICWRSSMSRLSIRPEEGMDVVVTGKLTTYPGRSKYQMIIDQMELAGEGALLKLLEERKKKLAAEGLFDESRKKPLPFLPNVIGVVTSPTGAVIKDILHRLEDRFPSHVLLWPVLVQGEGAETQIAAAIEGFQNLPLHGPVPRPDLLIVARGGGSLEDLMAFNQENVVRAVAKCDIPVISAVGHETDTTLIDYVADRRAPTPTGAAEIAVPRRIDLWHTVQELGKRQTQQISKHQDYAGNQLSHLSARLGQPDRLFEAASQRLDYAQERLLQAGQNRLNQYQIRLERIANKLQHPAHALDAKATSLTTLQQRLNQALKIKEKNAAQHYQGLGPRLRPPLQTLSRLQDRLTIQIAALSKDTKRIMETAETRLQSVSRMLESLSYERILDRGYAVVKNSHGAVISDNTALKKGDEITLHFRKQQKAVAIVESSE